MRKLGGWEGWEGWKDVLGCVYEVSVVGVGALRSRVARDLMVCAKGINSGKIPTSYLLANSEHMRARDLFKKW